MSMMQHELAFCKAQEQLQSVIEFIEDCSKEEVRVDKVERSLFEALLAMGHSLLSAFVAKAGDGDAGESIIHQDQELRRYHGQHPRKYRSIFGVIDISRCVYGIREGQKIQWVPLDAKLGLPAGEQSYVLEDWLQRMCIKDAFRESVDSLHDLLGVDSSTRAAETMNRNMGAFASSFWCSQSVPDHETEEGLLVVTADGKGIPMRRPLEERLRELNGKQPKAEDVSEQSTSGNSKRLGRGEKRTKKQMAYAGSVYTIAPFVRTTDQIMDEINRRDCQEARPRPTNKRVWAEMTKIREGAVANGRLGLFIRLALEAHRRDPDHQKKLICVMDGETALWAEKEEWLARAIGILDIYHVTERLWKVAYCFHGEGSRQAEQFVDHYLEMILDGKSSCVCARFRRLLSDHDLKGKKRKTVLDVIGYFHNHRSRMRYHEYLAAGYPIGSGVAEGCCRHLVKDRMERSGMRWEIEGAHPMVQLRAIYLNDQWNEFVEFRIENEQARLYGQAA